MGAVVQVSVTRHLHQHRSELWSATPPPPALSDTVEFPVLPHALLDIPRDEQERNRHRLDGQSFQERLRDLSEAEGLQFELVQRAAATVNEMTGWLALTDDRVLTLRLEADPPKAPEGPSDATFQPIGEHLGLRRHERVLLARAAQRCDAARRSTSRLRAMAHVHDPGPGRWRPHLDERTLTQLADMSGDAASRLGYDD